MASGSLEQDLNHHEITRMLMHACLCHQFDCLEDVGKPSVPLKKPLHAVSPSGSMHYCKYRA